MRYGIFSDVHSNLEALEAVLAALKQERVDKYLCVGDIVGYAADPEKCLNLIKSIVSVCVAGNHDWAATGKFALAHFNPYAKKAVIQNALQLSVEDKTYLNNLPLVFKQDSLTLVHATLDEPSSFNYLLNSEQAIRSFQALESQVCFIGHTHQPKIFEFKDDCRPILLATSSIKLRKNNKYIVNVGSVGQPRDGDSRASYCVFDTDKKDICIKRIGYDIKKAQKKILDARLPEFLATRLSSGC
jgi:predicted phosphodiesterase